MISFDGWHIIQGPLLASATPSAHFSDDDLAIVVFAGGSGVAARYLDGRTHKPNTGEVVLALSTHIAQLWNVGFAAEAFR